MAKRVIAVFTGNRAEYGLQKPIIRAIEAHPDLDCRLIVSGAHLDRSFGETRAEIVSDGFRVDEEVRIKLDESTCKGIALAISSGIAAMANALERLRPDILVVYADRFEGFAAVVAGTQMNLPTAHIEGGDLTEGGALDDSVRHAMTKLAHLHFTTNEQATNRILGLGEEPWRVETVGFPAIDLIEEGDYASEEEVAHQLDLDLSCPVLIFTQHSITTEFAQAPHQISPSLEALQRLADERVQVVATYPNNDAGGLAIIERLQNWPGRLHGDVRLRKSLGRRLYHGILGLARNPERRVVCVGNSSSGIKETPAFGCPAVNIGSRQDGRLRAANVIDTGYDADEIRAAARRALYDEAFRHQCRTTFNPYGQGDAGPKVAAKLASVKLDQALLRKKMTLRGEIRDGWFR
jgi:UDP-N-acetylglucosamine 2-epimerase (non-hydrolysing)/GDP/UDP-N,N'-diacetylbacillosamine 2-epimerase (hydrolysing)